MKLWVLRHGEAAAQAATDALRPLTDHGRKQVLNNAAHLLGQPLAGILASPYLRAQQTAQLVQQALGGALALHTVPWLTPDGDAEHVLAALDSEYGQGDWLLVSHQPLVGTLLGLLERGELASPWPMGTAALAALEGEGPWAGLMTLRALHPSPQ